MPLSVPGRMVPRPKIAAVERRKACALSLKARAAACVKARRMLPRLRLSALCPPRGTFGRYRSGEALHVVAHCSLFASGGLFLRPREFRRAFFHEGAHAFRIVGRESGFALQVALEI